MKTLLLLLAAVFLVLCPKNILAQNPAGIGTEQEVFFWLNAKDAKQNAQGKIAFMEDRSSNKRVFFQADEKRQPSESPLQQNHQKGIRFSSPSTHVHTQLKWTGNNLPFEFTLSVALQLFGQSDRSLVSTSNAFFPEAGLFLEVEKGQLIIRHNNRTWTLGTMADVEAKPLFITIMGRQNGFLEAFVNGIQAVSDSSGYRLLQADYVELGQNESAEADSFFDFYELSLFKRNLNDAELSILHNHLSATYKAPFILPFADQYFGDDANRGDFDFDMIGVGRVYDQAQDSAAGEAGLVLNKMTQVQAGSFMMAGQRESTNSVSTADLHSSIQGRWKREWYFHKNGQFGLDIGFSFERGMNGGKPSADLDNYKILFRPGLGKRFIPLNYNSVYTVGSTIYFRFDRSELTYWSFGTVTLGSTDTLKSPLRGVRDPEVRFKLQSTLIREGNAEWREIEVPLEVNGIFNKPVSIHYEVDGGAIPGLDYELLTENPLVYYAGVRDPDPAIRLRLMDRNTENKDVSFALTLTKVNDRMGNGSVGAKNRHVVYVKGQSRKDEEYTGPAGVGGKSSLSLWLSADRGVVANGENVYEWKDFSGNNRVLEYNAGDGKMVVEQAPELKNKSIIKFDGAGFQYALSDLSEEDQGYTIFAVMKKRVKGLPGMLIGCTDNSHRPNIGWYKEGVFGAGNYRTPLQAKPHEYAIYSLVHRPGAALDELSINGVSRLLGFDAEDVPKGKVANIGCNVNVFQKVNAAELIIYHEAVDDLSRQFVEYYLSSKYGISLTKSLGARLPLGYDVDVQGVGRDEHGTKDWANRGGGLILGYSTLSKDANLEWLISAHNNFENTISANDAPGGIKQRWSREWFYQTNARSQVFVGFDFDAAHMEGLADLSTDDSFVLLRKPVTLSKSSGYSSQSNKEPTFEVLEATASLNEEDNEVVFLVKSEDLGDSGYLTLGSIDGFMQPVPVKLGEFSLQEKDEAPYLVWKTYTELENYGFRIERRYDDKDWETLTFIEGHGTTTTMQSYAYHDRSPLLAGIYRYKLVQIDYDGKEEIIAMGKYQSDVPNVVDLESAYPNPFNPQTVIPFTLKQGAHVQMMVFDATGRKVLTLLDEMRQAGKHQVPFRATGLASGVYVVFLRVDQQRFSKTITLIQ